LFRPTAFPSLKKPPSIVDTMPIATPQGTLDFKSVDTITFVGASSNTVIDTTTGSLGVGVDGNGPTSNLHVVGDTRLEGDINMLHTSNTASIKLNSNVVTEFQRSKKLIKYPRVAMTGATTGGYTATASGEESATRQVENLFNNLKSESGGGWRSNTGYNSSGVYTGSSNLGSDSGGTAFANADKGEWVKIQLPHKIQLNSFTLTPRLSTSVPSGSALSYGRAEFIKNGKIWGSLNGTSWSVVHTISGSSASSDTVTNSYTVSSSTAYNYFALVVTNTNSGVAGIVGTSLSEWELFGTPEYDPEADGVDVVVKSVPNVPNTDWLEVYYDAKDLVDGAVTTVNDLKPVGTANNGTAFGDPQVSNGAFVFDGSGDYIRGQLTSFGGEQTFTFSLWFNMVEMVSGSNNSIFQIGSQGSSEEGLGFRVQTGSVFRMYTWSGPSNFNVGTVLPNTWYHAVGTYSGGAMTLYVDGNILQSTSGSSLDLPTNPYFALGVQITSSGTEYSTSGFNGSIANFRLFNRALTSDEIYQLYAYQKEYFGHGDLGMTLKAGRLGIGTSEPRAALDVRGSVLINGQLFGSGSMSGGNDIFDIDGYRVHVFTTSGNLWVLSNDLNVDVLLVAGGGGGGQDNAGGGGAGGLIFKPGHRLQVGGYTVIIGSGGSGCIHQNNGPEAKVGGNTEIKRLSNGSGDLVAYGGGAGMNGGSEQAAERNGGSGGGGASEGSFLTGGGTATQTGTYNYGNNGGNGVSDAGGGGGGAGLAGQNGSTDGAGYGGIGGDGLSGVTGYDFAEIFGTRYGELIGEDVWFAGGGAGANINYGSNNTAGGSFRRGGKGGGGGGPILSDRSVEVTSGLPNTGGGGNGAGWFAGTPYNISYELHGGDGGSGIVIFRYKL
jgi:hypothetical protein